MSILSEWQNFFVIVGSAAGGLTGLQFVTMALSALLVAPWHSLSEVRIVWGATGGAGVLYCVLGVWRMTKQSGYKPVLEDWIFRTVVPLAAFGGMAASAIVAGTRFRTAMFVEAFSVLTLLLIGIHNAWDNVTYIAQMKRQRKHKA